MKIITNALIALCLMLFAITNSSAQTESKSRISEFKVSGNCVMCKKTIENSLNGKPDILSAVWNKDTKIMKVNYDPLKVSEDHIHQKIADVGYDTDKKKASDKIYSALPACCQYSRTLHIKK